THELGAHLFSGWPREMVFPLVPDRFVPVSARQAMTSEFQRVLVLNRISLLTFPLGQATFGEAGSPYQRERCRQLATDRGIGMESWVCPDVGGIGYFPASVEVVRSRRDALEILGRLPPARLASVAFLGPEVDPAVRLGADPGLTAGAGRVMSFD